MKYKIKEFFKKTTSLTLALVMILSGVLVHVGSIALAAPAEYQQEDEVLCNESYDNAKNVTDRWSGYSEESNDLYPTVVEGNHVLKYVKSAHGVGVVPLGWNFQSNTLGTNYIAPKQNVTYKVEFQYKVSEVKEGQTSATSNLRMGIAVGNKIITDANEADWSTYVDYLSDTHTTARQVFDKIPKADVTVSSDWIPRTYEFTVPADCNVTDKVLQLFLLSGQGATILIDNVKVTALAGVTVNYNIEGQSPIEKFYSNGNMPTLGELPEDILITNASGKHLNLYKDSAYTQRFSLASYTRTGTYEVVNLYGRYEDNYGMDTVLSDEKYDNAKNVSDRWSGYSEESNDLFPTVVEENHVLKYIKSAHGVGVVPLGWDFKANTLGTNYIAPKQNATYKVEFQYKVSELKEGLTSATSNLRMGIAVGNKIITDANEADWSTYKDYLSDTHTTARQVFDKIPAANLTVSSDWIPKSYEFTVPADCNVTDKVLQLFLLSGAGATILIDNVKVTALAGAKVTYDVEGYDKVTKIYSDGRIPEALPSGIPSSKDGNSLVLYKDSGYKQQMSLNNYQRTGYYEEITIYGRYEQYKQGKDEVLFENDYSAASAKPFDATAVTQPWLGNDLFYASADLCVMKDPADSNNKAVHYSHYRKGYGRLILGDSYSDDKIEQSITVKKGVTYQVDFRWKGTGTPISDMTVGLGLGDATASLKDVTDAKFLETFSQYSTEFVLPKGTEISTQWQNYTAYFTVADATDLTKGQNLVLYAFHGNSSAHLYIDDVKVTALAGVNVDYVVGDDMVSAYYADGKIPAALPEGLAATDTDGNTLFLYKDKEYTTEFVAKDYVRTGKLETVTIYGKYEKFSYKKDTVLADETYDDAVIPSEQLLHKNSGDLQPAKDPTDSTDTVLQYKQRSVGLGVLQLGYDYTDISGTNNLTDYAKVYAGMTYKVTFDYLVKGTAVNNACEVGIAIGATKYDYGWPQGVHQGNYLTENVTWSQELMRFAVGETVDTGWQTKTLYITVAEDCDLSVYDALQLYAKGGSNAISVYFDNAKVIGLADRSYTVKFKTNGGNAIADKQVNLAGLNDLPQATRSNAVFMGWYLDAELTTPFDIDKCIDSIKPITVYAKWHIYTNGAVNTIDDLTFWSDKNGELTPGRLNYSFVATKENGNNVLQYNVGYAATKADQVEKRGDVKLTSATYPQRITLYNPDLTIAGDFDYMDVAYRAKIGKTYKISFQYKVTDIDTKNSDKGIAFSVLTGNIRNSHAEWIVQSNRFTTENTTTGWKTATTYFKVNELGKDITEAGVTYYSNAILLGVSGYGNVLIDDISVTDWDKEKATYIEFATKGGEAIPAQEYVINANTVLPKAVRKGYTFDAWYTDVKCTQKFNPATYKRTNGMLVLYAGYQGMQGVTEIDFEDYSYYLTASGEKGGSRIAQACTPYTEGDNTAVKFKLKYSTQKIEKWDECQGEYGNYGAAIGLHDPSVYAAKNATYEDAALRVKQGEKYWISFQYKAISVDTESTYPAAVTFATGVTKEDSIYSGRQFFASNLNPIVAPTDGWVTTSTYFTVPKLTAEGDRLTLFVVGYGEVLIDNIKVIKLTDAVIFDTDGGTVMEPLRGTAGQMVTLPKDPTRKDSKFMGWCTDINCTQEYSVAKMEKGVKILYAKFLTYQTIQDFESYSVGMSQRFETDYFLNKLTKDTKDTEYFKWLGSKYNAEQVRNGKVSVLRKGENQYSRLMGLFYMNNPLTVGEEYELSVWVKITDYFLPGDIQLVHSDKIADIRTEDYWSESKRGYRYETIANTELMSEYMGEWLEIKYTFTAKSKYVGLATPGITQIYIDDACMTLKSADESYARSIEGAGLKYEEWYSEDGKKEVVEEIEDFIKIDLNGNMNKFPWAVVGSIAGVVVVGVGLVVTGILAGKKKRGEVKQ